MWKTKEELTKGELLYLHLGYLMTQKVEKGKTYYNVSLLHACE